jgi:aspartate racemase
MVNAEVASVLDFVSRDDRAGLAARQLALFNRLHAAGAALAVIPSVTSHFVAAELAALSPIPMLNLFAPVREEVARRGLQRIALFGTRFVIRSNFFGQVPGVQFFHPEPAEIERIHEIYECMAIAGFSTPDQYATLRTLAHTLIERHQLDAIALAGTDLCLCFNPANTDFPALDCAALHIAAIAAAIL